MNRNSKKEKESIVDKEKKVAGWLQTKFVAGIFVFFPLAVTYFILNFAFNLIDGIFRPYFETLFNRSLPGISFILIIILVLLLGILASNAFTRRKFSWIETVLKKILKRKLNLENFQDWAVRVRPCCILLISVFHHLLATMQG